MAGVLEAALYVGDLDEATDFYGGLLGFNEIARVPGRHVFYRCGATILLIFDPAATRIPSDNAALPVPTHGSVGAGHVCFAADARDLARWDAYLSSQGIDIEADFHWPNGARSIYLRDPSGNSVEFAEPSLWETDDR